MEATLMRVGPALKKRTPCTSHHPLAHQARIEDPRRYEFFCAWAGDPAVLEELIDARVDWGPFEVWCERTDAFYTDHCRCEVRYNGPIREKQYLMKSFWDLIETFPPFE